MASKQIKIIITADGKQYAVALDKATGKTKQLDNQTKKLDNTFGSVRQSSVLLKAALIATGAVLVARQVSQYADAWINANNQIRVNIDTQEEFLKAQSAVIEIALETRSRLSSVASLYGRMSAAAGELNATQEEVAKLTRLAAQAIAVQGSSAGEASGALLQLSQLLGGNVVQAQEFNSLIDGARPLLVAVANGSDRFGGSVAKLREEVRAGTVTAKEFFQAALAGSEVVSSKFAKAQKSISQGNEVFTTGLTVSIGTLNEFLGSSDSAVAGLTSLSEMMIDFSSAVTGSLDPTDDLSINMKTLATGAILTASGLNLVGDTVREAITLPFKVAGENIGAFAAALVAVSKGEFSQAAEIIKLRLGDMIDIPGDLADEFNKSTAEAGVAMDVIRELWDKTTRDVQAGAGKVEGSLDKIEGSTQEANKAAQKYIASLVKQAQLIGLNAVEAAKYEASLRGATDAQVKQVGAIATFIEASNLLNQTIKEGEVEDKVRQKSLEAFRDSLKSEIVLEQERYENSLELLNEFLIEENITIQEFNTLKEAAAEDHAARVTAIQKRQFDEMNKDGKEAAQALERAFRGFGNEATRAIVEFAKTGELSVGSMVDSILTDLARLAVQRKIMDPLLKAFDAVLGNLSFSGIGKVTGTSSLSNIGVETTFAGVAHRGGIGAYLADGRQVSAALFDNAPRFHRGRLPGLADFEMPAIIRKDEGVFTPEQMRAMGSPNIVVNIQMRNESGTPLQGQVTGVRQQGNQQFIQMTIKQAVNDGINNGQFDRTLASNFGLNRKAVSRS